MSNDERFSQVVLGAVFDRLDSVFPEFGWQRRRNGWIATNEVFSHASFKVRAERIVSNNPSGFHIHGAENMHWLEYIHGGGFPRGDDWHIAATELARRVGMPGFEKRSGAGQGNVWLRLLAAAREQLESARGEGLRAYCTGRGAPWQEWQLGGIVNLEELLDRAGLSVVEARRQRILTSTPGEEWWSGRVVGVVRDGAGEPVGMWGRNTGTAAGPRYLMSGQGAPAFYGRRTGKRLVVVEGFFDAMRVAGLGEAAEALGGTSVSDGSLAAWRDCSEVVVCLDGDEAGLEGLKRIMKLLPRAEGLPPVSVVLLPPDSDLDEVLREDATTAWSEFLGARTPWLTFVVRAELEPVRGEGDESVALRRVGAVCKASVAGWPSEVGVALREAAKMVGIDERFLARVYDKVQSP